MTWLVGTSQETADREMRLRRAYGIGPDGLDPPRGARCLPPPFGRVVRYADVVESDDGRAAINLASSDVGRVITVRVDGRDETVDTRGAGPLPVDFVPRLPGRASERAVAAVGR